MAELDYAFLADYASVDGDKLTAAGASFTYVEVPYVPAPLRLFVAGRIRAKVEETEIDFALKIVPPSPAAEIVFEGTVVPNDSFRPYDGKVGVLFALEVPLTLHSEGLHEVFVSVSGAIRRLAFSVERG